MRNSFFSKSYTSLLLLLYFGLMPVLMGSLLASYVLLNVDYLVKLSLGALIFFTVTAGFGLALGLMPTTFFSLLTGYLFGWYCVPFVFCSYLIASASGYWLCRVLDREKLVSSLDAKYPASVFISKLSTSGVSLAAFCRLSPTLPFAVLNALFAMANFKFGPYLMGSLIGMIPRTLFAIYIGSRFTHITRLEDLHMDGTTWFSVILLVVSFAGIGWLVKRKLF